MYPVLRSRNRSEETDRMLNICEAVMIDITLVRGLLPLAVVFGAMIVSVMIVFLTDKN